MSRTFYRRRRICREFESQSAAAKEMLDRVVSLCIPSEQKSMKNFGEKKAWAYRGTAQIFGVPPIISGTGKATDFKFGQYIQRVHPNKSPLKILEKSERGPKGHPPTPRGTWGNFGETRGGVGKNGTLEHKSGNISETRTDRGKVTMGSP